ncbi:MAG: hypothetical protein ABI446_00845 [Gemmatimonadaceae bacterium]
MSAQLLVAIGALCLALTTGDAASSTAVPRTHLPKCGLSTGPKASIYEEFIHKIVVADDDTASRRMLKFKKTEAATWVTSEATCERAIASLNKSFFETPIKGPIYLMQTGSDYAGFASPNDILFHFDRKFKIIASGAWQ